MRVPSRGCRSRLPCAVVLGDEGGKRVAEILHRQIGEGVDLDRRRKRSHYGGAEAVDQTLHHQNAEVHHGLLHAGQAGKLEDLLQDGAVVSAMSFAPGSRFAGIYARNEPENADAGHILGDDRRPGRARNAPMKNQHEQQVKTDVQHRRHG